MSSIAEIKAAVEGGKVKLIEGIVQQALDAGEKPNLILDEGMIAAMANIGAKFQANEVFVPEMLVAAKSMKKGVEILRPFLTKGSLGKLGKFIIGTVAGDLHDIGKNLVALMIESAGFEVIDLGVDVAPEKFVEALSKHPDCKIVGASSLLTTTMTALKDTVDAIHAGGYKEKVKIMVGGAPVTQEFADEIGANAYTPDAGSAAAKAIELVS
jgi:corrinoid protein of di/trimethylamine methyltransferase